MAEDELAADMLDLLTDVQFLAIEADQFPGEPQQFTFAQAEDQDQDVGRVQRVVIVAADSRNWRA